MTRSPWSAVPVLLVLVMAAGSIVMWVGVPLGLIYLASRLSDAGRPAIGPYVLVIVGLPLGMGLVGVLLARIDRVHARLTGRRQPIRRRASWLRSLRGERAPARAGGVLDQVMLVSVVLAVIAFGVWFFGFAGSSLPRP